LREKSFQLRRIVGDLRFSPQFNLTLQRLEVPLNPIHSSGERVSMRLKLLVCLARTGVNTPETMLAKFWRVVESC
jgi:hypothetical protein